MAVQNAHSSITTEKNGSVVVGSPRGAKTDATSGPLGTNYILSAGDVSDLGTGSVAKGAVGGVNDAADVAGQNTKYAQRWDDPRYYSGDSATDS